MIDLNIHIYLSHAYAYPSGPPEMLRNQKSFPISQPGHMLWVLKRTSKIHVCWVRK